VPMVNDLLWDWCRQPRFACRDPGHASKHAAATGHPVITSFEPGEDWFFERVPGNWESLLN